MRIVALPALAWTVIRRWPTTNVFRLLGRSMTAPTVQFLDSVQSNTTSDPIYLTVVEAAAVLRVCEKALRGNTKPKGSVPCVRLGRRMFYTRAGLAAWVDAEVAKSANAVVAGTEPADASC